MSNLGQSPYDSEANLASSTTKEQPNTWTSQAENTLDPAADRAQEALHHNRPASSSHQWSKASGADDAHNELAANQQDAAESKPGVLEKAKHFMEEKGLHFGFHGSKHGREEREHDV